MKKTFDADLKAQRNYVNDLRTKGFNYTLVAAEAFVRGMRDSGYRSTATALDDIIDNAIEALAERIDIVLGWDKGASGSKLNQGGKIAIVDDGHGMDPDMMRVAVLWGGTHRENNRTGFGRYGFGLPSASVSIARKYTVFSKVPGGNWYSIAIDIDKIAKGEFTNAKSGNVEAPEPSPSSPPDFIKEILPKGDLEHGTIVLLENLDRLTSGFNITKSFEQKIMEHIGLIYRGLFREISIFLTDTAKKKGTVAIEPVDPLFLDPNSRFYDEYEVKAEGLPGTSIEVKNKITGQTGVVKIRYAYFHPTFMKNKSKRLSVRKENEGFIIMRAGRQIQAVKSNPWFSIVNNDRYWGVEIDFEPTLDELFGVTVNKQQIEMGESLWDIFEKNGMHSAIKAFRSRYKKDAADEADKSDTKIDEKRPSEKAMEEAAKFKNTRKSGEQNKIADQQSEEEKQQFEEEVERESKKTGRPKEDIIEDIEKKPFKIITEHLPGAPFYRVYQFGAQKQLFINTAHRFFTDVYRGPESTPGIRTALEIFLFVLGDCELESSGDRDRFYQSERHEWSKQFDLTLDILNEADPVLDKMSAKMEEDENGGNLPTQPEKDEKIKA